MAFLYKNLQTKLDIPQGFHGIVADLLLLDWCD